MKITFISDTHGRHKKLELTGGDLLIHCGDVTAHGSRGETLRFIDWLDKQEYKNKVFIAGNHDRYLYECHTNNKRLNLPKSVHYLCNDSTKVEGLNIYGSPYTPEFCNWYFMGKEDSLLRILCKIPLDIDIVITHGPPFGILDKSAVSGRLCGSTVLSQVISDRKPKVHCFGHIHEGRGEFANSYTRFVNCSVLDDRYLLVSKNGVDIVV